MDVRCRPTPSCLRPGAPTGACPIAGRAFAPVVAAEPTAKSWSILGAGALAALGARRPASVLVIGSGLTGVDVALHLIARAPRSRCCRVTARCRAVSAPPAHRRVASPRCPRHENSLEQLRAALARISPCARGRFGLATSDRRGAATHDPAVAVVGVEDQRRFLREDCGSGRFRVTVCRPDRRCDYAAIDSGQLMIERRGRRRVAARQWRRTGRDNQRRISAPAR